MVPLWMLWKVLITLGCSATEQSQTWTSPLLWAVTTVTSLSLPSRVKLIIWSSSSFNMLIPSPFLTTITAPLARMNAMSLNHSTCPPCVYRLNSLYTREFCALFCFKELLQLTDCSEIVKNFKLNVSVIYLLSLYFFVTTHSIRTHTKKSILLPHPLQDKTMHIIRIQSNTLKYSYILLHKCWLEFYTLN